MPAPLINSKEDAFRLFDEAIYALVSSNFIIAQRPISDLLRCLIFSSELHAFISECVRGVNYQEELKKAFQETESGSSFVLPKSNKRIIALVTGLLSDFDRGEKNLTAFMRALYPANDNATQYKLFCENVIVPFYEAFRQSFLYNTDGTEIIPEEEKTATITQSALEQAEAILTSLRTVFQGDNKLSSQKREDLLFLTDSIYYSLEKGDLRLIKAVWTGLKLALSGYKKADLSSLEEFFALYALL